MKEPKIGVCVAAYNRERYLSETLESLLANDYPHFQIFVTADGSSDFTERIIIEYAHRSGEKVKNLGDNKTACVGTSKNRLVNAALEAGCSAIQMLDSDDLAMPTLLSDMYEKLCSGGYDWVNCHGRAFGGRDDKLTSHSDKTVENMIDVDYLTSWGMFKKETLAKHNYRVGLKHLDDWELYLRLLKNGMKYAILDKELVRYRCHDDQLTKTKKHEKNYYHKKILKMNDLPYLKMRFSE